MDASSDPPVAPDPPLRHLVGTPGDAVRAGAAWAERGLVVRSAHGTRMRSSPALFAELAVALGLPAWFGANYDALDESLRDLVADTGPGLVLVLADAEEVLVDEPPAQLRTLVRLLQRAHAAYAGGVGEGVRSVPAFHVVLQHEGGLARWRAAGADPAPLGAP